MNSKEYCEKSRRTDTDKYEPVLERLSNLNTIKINHALMGITTETGELMDALKKHVIYGKPLDIPNIKEEVGDLFWYLALLAHVCDFSFEEVMQENIDKLIKRYPEKFTEKDAIERKDKVDGK